MLQINTGKLFQNDIEYKNELRGVVYSNLSLLGERQIETVAGTIKSTSNLRSSKALIYELTELIESRGSGPCILVSHGIDPFLSDFSTILSFSLNCVASPDYELTSSVELHPKVIH